MDDGTKSTDPANAKYFKKKAKKGESEDDEEPKDLQPKRPCSSYMYFNIEKGAEIRVEHPDWKMGEVSGEVGKLWEAISDADKKPYEALNAKSKTHHEKQVAELAKKGYFTLDDGSKSTDTKNVPKKRRSKASKAVAVSEEKVVKPRKSVTEGKQIIAKTAKEGKAKK